MNSARAPRPASGNAISLRKEFVLALVVSLAAFTYALVASFNDFQSEEVAVVQGTAADVSNQSGAVLFRLREHSLLFAFRAVGGGRSDVRDALVAAGESKTKVWFRKTDPFAVWGAPGEHHLVTSIEVNGNSIVDEARVRRQGFQERAGLVVLGLGVWLFYGFKVASRRKRAQVG